MYEVSVQIVDGVWSPICMTPGADNTINCYFTYDYLEHSPNLAISGGYRMLGLDTAREACKDAVGPFSLGQIGAFSYEAAVMACARALTMHRWIDDNEYGIKDPNQ